MKEKVNQTFRMCLEYVLEVYSTSVIAQLAK